MGASGMSPLQRQAVQCVREYGKPLRPLLLAAVLDRSHESACSLLKAAYDEGALSRTDVGNLRGGRQWGYSLKVTK